MPALKLFLSHSSRLDDVEHKYTRDDRNWCLLEDTCRAVGEYYGDRVDVLVDKDGLIPGDDWNHQLNLWLAECHVAVILFSKRAIEKSDWVAKEAAILSWRAEIDERFKLIPVLLDGEATPEDLAREFAGTLQINKSQCIRNARGANDILAGVRQQLGEPGQLTGTYSQTPLEYLQGGIAKFLADGTTAASLQAALAAVQCRAAPVGTPHQAHYAHQLAQRFFTASEHEPHACFNTFQLGVDPLRPRPIAERAEELFEAVRPLWVEPRAAARLRRANRDRFPLALAGLFVTLADSELRTLGYTLERYLERAWPGSRLWLQISASASSDIEAVKSEIRRTALGPGLPPTIDAEMQDRLINQDVKLLVLVVTAPADQGGLPDPARLMELRALQQQYSSLLLIFAVESNQDPLPESIPAVEPALDPRCEQQAYLHERSARIFLNNIYGSGH